MIFPRRKLMIPLLGVSAIVALVVFVFGSVFNREPFRLKLTPVNGRSVIQFTQPDRNLVTAEFPVELSIDEPRVVELRSRSIPIPGCTIEFYDITLLPGRFQIRIGRTLFDVMDGAIMVDGQVNKWYHGEPPARVVSDLDRQTRIQMKLDR